MKKVNLFIVFLLAAATLSAVGCTAKQNRTTKTEIPNETEQVILHRDLHERDLKDIEDDCDDGDCEKNKHKHDFKFVKPEHNHSPRRMPHKPHNPHNPGHSEPEQKR